MLGGVLNGYVFEYMQGNEEVHCGKRFGTRNTEGERILQFGDSQNMDVPSTLFKECVQHVVHKECE